MTTIDTELYSQKILLMYYRGCLNKILFSNLPTIRRDRRILYKLKRFKKKCNSIPNMNSYAAFECDGVKYILGDDACVYFNRKNKGLYTKVLGYLDYTNGYKIEWLPGEEIKHLKKAKGNTTGVLPIEVSKKDTGNNGLKNENNVINEFNHNIEYRKNLCSKIGIPFENVKACKLNKSNGFSLKHTDIWDELKKGTGEKYPSSKTDIVLINPNTKQIICKLSLKSGEGRPTSCNYYEQNALFNTVIKSKSEYEQDQNLRETIQEILNITKSISKLVSVQTKEEIHKQYITNPEKMSIDIHDWYSNYLISKTKLDSLWSLLLDNHHAFIQDVFHECLWGNHKFGDTCGRADYLLITKDSNSVEIDSLINLDSLTGTLLDYCNKCIVKNKKPFAIKSSRSKNKPYTLWIRFL